MKLSERIEALMKELVEKKDQLVQSTESLEAAPDEESLLVEVEELTGQVEKMEETLGALKKAEKALAVKAEPVAPAVAVDMQKRNKFESKANGELLFKHATIDLLAFVQKKDPRQVIEERYSDIDAIKDTYNMVKKSQVDPAMTSVSGWAAELVQNDTRGFLESLEELSVAAALASYATNLSFGGYNSVTVPMENAGPATPTEPAWVAEGAPIPLTQFSYGAMTLNRYKLGAISTFTREIAERSTPAIEGLLRNALRKAYAKVLDQALLSNQPAITNVRPAGLIAPPLLPIAQTAGGGDGAVRGDIMALVSAMTAANLGAKPVLIMNNMDRLAASMMVSSLSEYIFRDELSSGSLMSIPTISSGNVPQHFLVLVDANDIATAFDVPDFNVSDVATVVEASANDTPPTMASDATGAASNPDSGIVPPAGGIPVNADGRALGAADAGFKARSLWQTYSIGIRMVAPTSWGIMRAGAVNYIPNTTWTT